MGGELVVCCSIITVLPNLPPLCAAVKLETQEIKALGQAPLLSLQAELAVLFSVLRFCGLQGHDTAQGTVVALSYK